MEPITDLEHAYPSIDRADDTTESSIRLALGERTLEPLIPEIRRYLAVVEVFRGEGCEPRWI